MKMPDKIEETMFAPCGMNCMVCYKHCYTKKPCEGCFNSEKGKPEHCRRCKIKECTNSKEIKFCYKCGEFPCKLIKNLEKSYNTRYNTSLISNSLAVKREGLETFMKRQQHEYKCDHCGGIISLHDSECSECKKEDNSETYCSLGHHFHTKCSLHTNMSLDKHTLSNDLFLCLFFILALNMEILENYYAKISLFQDFSMILYSTPLIKLAFITNTTLQNTQKHQYTFLVSELGSLEQKSVHK